MVRWTQLAYMAISGQCLLDIIKPEFKGAYLHGLEGFCTNESVHADDQYHWFPRTCCLTHSNYDKRTPGLFKLEYEGDEIIGLCSKTYIVKNGSDYKFSSKGISKKKVKNPILIFENVLKTQKPGVGTNIGFRAKDNTIFTYTQDRCGFSYYYCKRKIADDGIHSEPLDIVITPFNKFQPDSDKTIINC